MLNSTTRVRNQREAENLISRILDRYNDAGFPFCRVTPEMIIREDGPPALHLAIDEGPRITIDDLLIKNSRRTDQGAARRLANFKRGLYFSRKNTELAKRRLMGTGAFEGITDKILDRDGRYYVMFLLREKDSDFLTLSGSFSGTDLSFGAALSSCNILGTLRQLDFDYEYQRLFSFKFREPVLIAPAQIDAEFSILTYDSARLTKGHVRFAAPVGAHFKISLLSGIELTNYYVSDTASRHGSSNLLGVGLEYDLKGSEWATVQVLHFDHLFREADRSRFTYDGEFAMMKVVLQAHYRRVATSSYEFFDYVRIGGARSLRGYLEDEFTATRALWLNIEYHRLFIFPMVDIARIDREIVFSYGFGMKAKSRIADASLIIAWPGSGKWLDGKIHLTFARAI
ncbi:hypothetical protein IBX73_02180 [candidate division WOR-3 bacterium]|nr:hypothetical protein [candidate division WOR-3 bacterium]